MLALKRISLAVAPWVPLPVVGAFIAYWEMFSRFAILDDEGYLMSSLNHFTSGGALYDQVFSQYGPFYYEFFGLIAKIGGFEYLTDSGRFAVIVLWLLGAITCGVGVHRLTGSVAVGVAAQVTAFGALLLSSGEPMHPEVLSALMLLLIVAVLATTGGDRGLPGWSAIAAGALIACLLGTKINLGTLAAVAIIAAAMLSLPGLATRRWVRPVAIATLIAVPILIPIRDLDQDHIQDLLMLVLGGVIATVLALPRLAPADDGGVALGWVLRLVGAIAGAGLAVVVVIVALGTSPGELWSSVITRPAQLPNVFWAPVDQRDIAAVLAIAAVATAWFVRGLPPLQTRRDRAYAGWARVALGLFLLLMILADSALGLGKSGRVAVPMVLVWIVVLAPAEAVRPSSFARAVIALLAVVEAMQAYPVAGTQLQVSSLIFVPAVAVIVADGVAQLRANWDGSALAVNGVLAAVLAAVVYSGVVLPLHRAHARYSGGVAISGIGAGRMRLPAERAREYTAITDAARANCRGLITIPGPVSFNLWTGIPTPDGFNASDWVYLVYSDEQAHVVKSIGAGRGMCLIANYSTLTVWLTTSRLGPFPRWPELRYIENTAWKEIARGQKFSLVLYRRARPGEPPTPGVIPAGY